MNINNIIWGDSEGITINGNNTSALLEDVSDTLTYYADKYIITKYPIKTGDLVEYAGITYIVVSQIDRNIENRKENQFNYRARIRQADYIIKLVIDGKVEKLPSIIEGQAFDIIDGKYISLSGDKIVVTINNTYAINKGMRFIKLESVWKVVGIDRTKNGLVTLYCDVDLYNATTDDMENEIANIDLIVEEPEEPDPSGGITYTIEGSDTLKVYDAQLYIAKKFIDGVQDTTAKFTFTVSDETMAEIWEVTDTTLDLEGKNKNVGQFFTITATDRVSGEIITKQVQLINNY